MRGVNNPEKVSILTEALGSKVLEQIELFEADVEN
jgi:hypothetical protein